ncbi:amino acid adenylation domain-containing protein [Nocardia sp. NBC_00565]|uniref:non-ribosomal peptide synthetase n=1 Tax=Nocardia sp. NBC_00565 TaxID=2975993 RepID=UPI002E8062FA|nr:amino acid adenylation domain-containing protein [Nocardia sp. NBC_00565]WUC04028.1 amino acid adenylation domain-containing protein [Nocardia sp. NBC_00565]
MDSLYHRIRRGIENFADAVALVDNGRALTYRELGHRVDAVADRLRHNGVEPETVTAICVREPSTAIVSVLAVWAVGGAYLPLDADFPDETLRRWMAGSGVRLVLTEPEQQTRLSGLTGAAAVVVDASEPELSASGDALFEGPPHPRSLAYVMFTSGSTGRPKGVAVEHHSLAAYHTALSSYVSLGQRHVVLQVAAFTFDPWLRDALMPLAAGARVVVTSKSVRRNPEQLLTAARAYGVTHLLSATPALLTGLVTSPMFAVEPPRLETTLVSGESFLPLRAHAAALARFGRVVNHFGLTETTLIATQYASITEAACAADVIGTPLPGVSVHLLDSALQPVGQGEVGEIYIGGTGVSRGYLGAVGRTATRFIADPFVSASGAGGARLYRTGDLGRLLADATLEYLGRRDRQINLRGHRVEPAEVELALTRHPAVRSAVVVGHRRPVHGIVLVGYVVGEKSTTGAALDSGELRAHLAALLPAHMIPATYVFLDRLPLGATGKVDRSALPAPTFGGHRASAEDGVREDFAPSTAVQRAIAEVWSEVLNVPEIARDDNFFDLGGHSLLAARIANRLASDLGRDFTTERILGNPTVALLAANLPGRVAAARPTDELVRRTGTRYPLSAVQRGLWHLTSPEARPQIVARAFRLNARPDRDRLAGAVAAVMRRHAVLRCAFDAPPGRPPGQTVRHRASAAVRTATAPADTMASELALACATGMDVTRGQVIDVTLYEHPTRAASESACTLLVRCHRLVADEPAVDVLVRELGELYSGVRGTAGLAEPAANYPEFARAQDPIADAGKALRYWQSRLDGVDPSAPADAADAVSSARLSLPAAVVRPLRAEARSLGLDLPAVLRTAFATALAADEPDRGRIAVCTTVLRRPAPEWEPVIGPFARTEPAVVDVGAGHSLRQLLVATDHLRDAAAFAEIPVEFLCGELGLSPSMLTNRVLVHPAAAEPLQLDGVEATPVELPVFGAHTMRLLEVTEQAGGLTGGVYLRGHDSDAADRIAARVRDLLTELVEGGNVR